jgi:hypothetical protein
MRGVDYEMDGAGARSYAVGSVGLIEESHMRGGAKTITILIVASAVMPWLNFPAHSQGLSKMGHSYAGPPVENHPKIDEKAYKDALERIPAPDQKFDPWGIARPSEPAKGTKKSN